MVPRVYNWLFCTPRNSRPRLRNSCCRLQCSSIGPILLRVCMCLVLSVWYFLGCHSQNICQLPRASPCSLLRCGSGCTTVHNKITPRLVGPTNISAKPITVGLPYQHSTHKNQIWYDSIACTQIAEKGVVNCQKIKKR